MDLRIARVIPDSVVDGPGLRAAVFFQGCAHRCKGCHNPSSWKFDGGTVVSPEDLYKLHIASNPILTGVTLTGGDPLYQPCGALELINLIRSSNPSLSIWVYTGFLYEELCLAPLYTEILERIDVLVDGEFDLSRRTLECPWRGSSNQRLIDCKNSSYRSIQLYTERTSTDTPVKIF